MSTGRFANGVESGPWVTWHSNGELESEGSWLDGVREGAWVFRAPDGSLDAERTGVYENGRRTGPWTVEGEREVRTPSGVLVERCEYAGGTRHGRCTLFHADGGVRAEGRYADGWRTGVWTFRRADGSIDPEASGVYAGVRLRSLEPAGAEGEEL
jgi:antitoxin component YwqK of YwqJK toxin-antitoxin module